MSEPKSHIYSEQIVVHKDDGILGLLSTVENDGEFTSECIVVNLEITIDETWFDGPTVMATMNTPPPVEVKVEPKSRIEL